jgi:hypothetical protein
MITTIFLVLAYHGVIQFLLPMKDEGACNLNKTSFRSIIRPDADVSVRCFDALSQTYMQDLPRPQSMPFQLPFRIPMPNNGTAPIPENGFPAVPQKDQEKVD